MWPKILTQYLPQLIELLPHVSRVVPMADKYLSQRGASDARLEEIATGVRGDLGRVAKAHIALAEQLDSFAGHVGDAAAEAKRARQAAEQTQAHVELLEKQVAGLRSLLVGTLVAVLLILLLVAAAFVLAARSH